MDALSSSCGKLRALRALTHPLSPGHQNQQSLGLALEKATWYELVYQSCKVVPHLVVLASHKTSHNYMDLYGVKNYVIRGWIYDMGNSKIEENRSCYKWVKPTNMAGGGTIWCRFTRRIYIYIYICRSFQLHIIWKDCNLCIFTVYILRLKRTKIVNDKMEQMK